MDVIDNNNFRAQNLIIFGLLILISLFFRLSFVVGQDFPLNDGGLFTEMTEEIIENDFILPYFTSYNSSDIPYAYPPLGFYLAATLAKLTGIEVITIIQYLPGILSSFTIPAFYFLGTHLLKSKRSIYIATAIYLLVPRSWSWMIMGGGLTRSLGVFFALLAILFSYRLFSDHKNKNLIFAIIFISLTVLSHPETSVFLVVSILLLFIFFSRSLIGLYKLFIAGLGTLFLTGFWWLSVILRHGTGPFLAAFNTSGFGIKFVKDFFLFGLTEEVDSHIIAALAIVGLFYMLGEKRPFLPFLLISILIFTPRSGPNYAMIPVSFLSGITIGEIILPVLSNKKDNKNLAGYPSFLTYGPIPILLMIYFLISTSLSAFLQPYLPDSVLTSISSDDRSAMAWVSKNTPEDSAFLILTEKDFWEDKINEWFPYLAGRKSLTTLQGLEWSPENRFNIVLTWYKATKTCLNRDGDCLENWSDSLNIPYTHVYLPKPSSSAQPHFPIYYYLRENKTFTLIYDGPGAAIFEVGKE